MDLGHIVEATPDTFDALVTSQAGLVVAYFWGPDCPNCEIFARDLPALMASAPPSVRWLKVDAYLHTDLAARFGLFGVPAFVLFKGGRKLGMMREYRGRDFFGQVVAEQAEAA